MEDSIESHERRPSDTSAKRSLGAVTTPDAGQVVAGIVSTEDATSTDQTRQPSAAHRELRVFRPTDVPFDPRRIELPDDFYAATPADVKVSQETLSSFMRSMNDAPLMTKKLRDAEQAKKMSRFAKVLIRVRLPDRTALQGTFTPSSTVRDIRKFVSEALRDPTATRFHLFVVPPKTILNVMNATIWNLGLAPAALVYMGLEAGPDDSALLLSEAALALLEDSPQPGALVYSTTAPPISEEASSSAASAAKSASSKKPESNRSSSKLAKKIPKWFQK
jgi:tether containing UBX domain for GLUT4